MWAGCLLLFQIITATTGYIVEPNKLPKAGKEVFLASEEASEFIGRRLLYNSWDFEAFTPGNLERECYEEVCNFEEARECFEDDQKTKDFWSRYQHNGQGGSGKSPTLDVAGLVAGLVAGVIILIMIGVLIMYCVRYRAKERTRQGRPPVNLTCNIPLAESVPLTPLPLPEPNAPGLPSYEEALEASGTYDAPPPPYQGGSTRSNQPS